MLPGWFSFPRFSAGSVFLIASLVASAPGQCGGAQPGMPCLGEHIVSIPPGMVFVFASTFKGRRCCACQRDLLPIGFQLGIQCVPFPMLCPWCPHCLHMWFPTDLPLDPHCSFHCTLVPFHFGAHWIPIGLQLAAHLAPLGFTLHSNLIPIGLPMGSRCISM